MTSFFLAIAVHQKDGLAVVSAGPALGFHGPLPLEDADSLLSPCPSSAF